LITQLKEKGIDFKYLGLVFDETIKNEVFRKCHFGINMFKDKVIVGLTMKSLDYFRVGLPTVNMNIYDTGILVREYQSGLELSKENWDVRMDELIAINRKEWEKLHENTLKMFHEKFSEAVFKKNFDEVLERCGISK
jgi:glycosyltransferase involved in cell wall biosynthesis